MQTVLSHIVETRLSQEYENVATDALAFVLTRNEVARQGLTNLLRVIIPKIARPPISHSEEH